MPAFSLAIFWGALLLFLVQPLIAKYILPWFGGSPAVWTTCMLFFQLLLLAGYAYAHFSTTRLRTRTQVVTHLALLGVSLLLLPIAPGDHWKPADGSSPTGSILLLLLGTIGLPYLALSATGPLFQAWFSRAHPGVSPYRLYALSNVGSLLALLGYPFLMEPRLGRHDQALWWSAGLAVFAGLAAWCGRQVWLLGDLPPAATAESAKTGRLDRGLWLALPACGVILLLSVTNRLCQDIAVIPFLWVLPLSLYLLTFIICFDSPRWYHRAFWLPLLGVTLAAVAAWMAQGNMATPDQAWLAPVAWAMDTAAGLSMFGEIGLFLTTLFVGCMVCHGEVYRLRPAAGGLTGFYLSLSAGGATGGLFVALGGPALFNDYLELHVGLMLLGALTLAALWAAPDSPLAGWRRPWAWCGLILLLGVFGEALRIDAQAPVSGRILQSRNFYGVLKVLEEGDTGDFDHKRTLQHGGTTHGLQFMAESRRRVPASYYTGTSGIGRAMRTVWPAGGRRIGVVGLGTGSMAAWGRPGDVMRFYEINDDVVRIARGSFTFLADTPAKVELVMGDARLSMEREQDQRYDVLVLDAFSSDAIPAHLLTKEAFVTYRRHLKPDGLLAVHISNRYLDLEPVVRLIAKESGLGVAVINDEDAVEFKVDEFSGGAYTSDWMLLSADAKVLAQPLIAKDASEEPEMPAGARAWTDERSDLLSVLMADEGTFLAWLKGL
ncbi:MAG: spermidine synthase [Opitutia bacterium]